MLPTNPDVLIIGAGAAGISAARACAERGLTCIVLEAGPRVGGRCRTTRALGPPLDLGATWLHAANRNPLTAFATDTIDHDTVRERHLWMGDRWADAAELAGFDAAEQAFHAAMDAAAHGPDRAVADVVPQGGFWGPTIAHWQGAQIQAREVTELSLHDQLANDLEGPNLLPRQGMGALLEGLATGLPIRLNAAVQRLDWSGPGVVAQGDFGSLTAGSCIVTVSTGVLAAGGIRFTPGLPDSHARAVEGLPMGLLTKIGFAATDRLGIPPFHGVRCLVSARHPRPMSWVMWPFDQDMLFGFVGGALAWELAAAGPAACEAAARAEFASIFGPGRLGRAVVSDWGENPLFRGAYSQARPGAAGARAALAQPLGPLRFAGEATHDGLAGTAGGAWLEGARAVVELSRR